MTIPASQRRKARGDGEGPLGIENAMDGPTTSAQTRRAWFRILRRAAGSIPHTRETRQPHPIRFVLA